MSLIVVIGSGISGTLTALELAEQHQVILVEAESEILPNSCSSRNQCFKLHTGMHYFGDLQTAKTCLTHSIAFARAFPDCIVGGQNILSPLRRGRHFVMSTSLISAQEALNVANALKSFYETLIKEDPLNQVFGSPDSFFRVLDQAEYEYLSKKIPYYDSKGECHHAQVALGLETAESLVDFTVLSQKLRQKIELNTNIRVLKNTKVTGISFETEHKNYILNLSSPDSQHTVSVPFVVNCAWQNIELLSQNLPQQRTTNRSGVNRVKITILIKLPQALHSLHTSLFSTGPYCSVTILNDGYAILASERLTNVGFYSVEESMPQELAEIVQKNISLETSEGQSLAKQILEDCSAYFSLAIQTLMNSSKIQEIRVGIVKHTELTKTYDNDSIYSLDSIIHSRVDSGVKCIMPRYITNASMKMIYAIGNAKKVKTLIENQHRLQANPMPSLSDYTIFCEEGDSKPKSPTRSITNRI